MAANDKRVTYFDHVQSPIYLDMLGAEEGVTIERLDFADGDEVNRAAMARTHAYQCTSAKDELPLEWWPNEEMIRGCPEMLIVSTNGAGYDIVDLDACTAAGVIAVNQAGGNKEGVAEHALALMLNLSKRIGETDHVMRREAGVVRQKFIGNDMTGKTVGIVGIGHVGTRVAELVKTMFDCRVLAYDPYVDEKTCRERGAEKVDLTELLGEADFVSIHCPLTSETRGIMDRGAFAAMKPGAYFVTTARGYIHDEAALVEALESGHVRGAGVDVFDIEPPPLDHPLLKMDNVIVSPHTAGVSVESRHNIARIGAEQMIAIFKGEKPPRLLNPDVWPKYQDRFEKTFGFRPAD